jgi:ribosomal protein L30/L7E
MVLAIIRIAGQVNINQDIKETLNRLKMMKKLTCIFIDEKDAVKMGMLEKVKNFVAYGTVDKKLMDEVIAKRGQKDVKGNFRGFCRMHPPIGGFKKSTQMTFPKGVLGKHEDISKLLSRMI